MKNKLVSPLGAKKYTVEYSQCSSNVNALKRASLAAVHMTGRTNGGWKFLLLLVKKLKPGYTIQGRNALLCDNTVQLLQSYEVL